MTHKARDLLAGWIAENVQSAPDNERSRDAAELAAEFLAYAKDAGLSADDLAELQEDFGDNLAGHLRDALSAAGGSVDEDT